jgi:branched-subunit amino acid transport protein
MTIWWTIIGLAVTTALVKAVGPVVFGGREPHPAFLRVVAMMAPALLAALVVTSALADGRQLGVGADTVGVLAGGVLLWRGRSVVLAVVVAVVVTAALRALT